MKKQIVLRRLFDARVVAVIRSKDRETALRSAGACIEGGIRAVEITYTVPDASGIIRELSGLYAGDGVLVGAGTVIDAETARTAMLAGASFLVSPTADPGLIGICNRYRAVCVAGAFTPNEVKAALDAGADLIKIFPASLCTPSYIRVLHGPFPQADFMVTGSMSFETAGDWLAGGAALIGVGGLLTDPAETGDFDAVRRNAERLCRAVGSFGANS